MSSSQYYQSTNKRNILNIELDVEKRLQAEVLKDRIRIKEFFHDFDRLRKGFVGEAAVITPLQILNSYSFAPASER